MYVIEYFLAESKNWIKLSLLQPLGFKATNLYFILLFLSIIICYATVKPVITWLTSRQYIRLLSYILSSLIILIAAIITLVINGYIIEPETFSIALQSAAFFGIALIAFHCYQWIKR